MTQSLGLLAASLGAALCAGPAAAQSTDGYHSIQVFPVVVDTASFTQRFNFRNPNSATLTIKSTYYPAIGLGTPVACNDTVIAAGRTAAILSLRTLCPAMNAGSQFGYLYTSELSANNLPYAGFSRVANPQGNGFAVEAFPAHTFTSADVVVNGIRRSAAGGGSPTFQTNCFVGNLVEIMPTGTAAPSTPIHYTVYDSNGNPQGPGGDVSLAPGQVIRLSDVFAAAGAPAGDYLDASVKFEELGPEEPGIMAFCTTQDNTSFGADFRVAKQELGAGGQAYPGDTIGAQDNHVTRNTLVSADAVGRAFTIPAGDFANTHIVYFRHPDYMQCELVDPATGLRALPGYGLEMRMLDQNGLLVAGGSGVTGWSEIYLGDKTDRNGGSNTRYRIEVEDGETNGGASRPYRLHCQSGSGHTMGDIIRYQEAIDRF